MKTFIKYFILLAVCTNALAMDNEYRGTSDPENLSFDENRVNFDVSTSGDYAAAPLTEPEAVDESRRTGFFAPISDFPSSDSSFQSKYGHYLAGIDYSEASASPSSASAPESVPSDIHGDELDELSDIIAIPPFPCPWPSTPECHETFENLKDLHEHIKNTHIHEGYSHSLKHWPCPLPVCRHFASCLSRLLYHMFKKKNIEPWQCKSCKNFSSNLESLQSHVKKYHLASSSSASAGSSPDAYIITTQQLPCPWPSTPECHETFENLDDLLEHIQKNHITVGYKHDYQHWPCPLSVCRHTEYSLNCLIYHLFKKKNIEPWQCKSCECLFSNLESLHHHVKKHHLAGSSTDAELDTRDKALAISPEHTAKPPRKARRKTPSAASASSSSASASSSADTTPPE